MLSISNIVITLTILLALSHVGTCLECYQCSSALNNKNCADSFSFNEDTMKKYTCKPGQDACTKIKAGDAVERDCGIANFCDTIPDCSRCNSELCNSSSSMVPSFIVTSFAAIIFAKYFF